VDVSRQTEASLATRLDALRKRVLDAEKKVEDFKAANGLIGTRDLLVTEQQLRDANAQITIARTKAAEARSRLDQIEKARRPGSDVAALASQIMSTSLAALRAQQALAHQRLADLTGQLGPRHPQVIDATAQVGAADAAVEAELTRFAESQRIEYQSAKQLEASLGRQLDELKAQTNANGQSSVGLRDLERDADAARSVYELFVTRSRDAGEIQQVEPTRTRIISLATPPKSRAFPPSGTLMAAFGLLIGLGLGVAGSLVRERQVETAPPDAPDPKPKRAADDAPARPAATFAITRRSRLETTQRTQSLGRLDLAGLGFLALPADADSSEFEAILHALGVDERLRQGARPALAVAVVGSNDDGLRTSLAINLALCAARRGVHVALIDAAERNAKLTRAIRRAAQTPVLNQGAFYLAANRVVLALPQAFDTEIGRMRPDELLHSLTRLKDEAFELIICDGPDAHEGDAARVFGLVDEVVAIEETPGDEGSQSQLQALADAGVAARALVRFDAATPQQQKRA
jgi:Mrp family chromosome partitioning ATPase